MDVVMMAGGEGTRLRPLTLGTPKPLAPVCNRPIMEHIVDLCVANGLKDIHCTLHYLADEIMAHFGDGSAHGANMSYTVEEDLLGTAGSVRNIDHELKSAFMILSGDSLMDLNLAEAIKFHKKKKALATIVLARVPTPLEYGVVIVDDRSRIVRFLEKPGWGEVFSDTVNTGIYILEPQVLDLMEKGKNYDWSKDIFPRILAEKGALYGCTLEGYWCDVGGLKAYREAHEDILNGKLKVKLSEKAAKKNIFVGEGCEIDPKAILKAPVQIGNHCKIQAGAVVGPYTVLGDNAVVEEKAILSHTIAWKNGYFGRKSILRGTIICRNGIVEDDCLIDDGVVVGDNCTIGKGTKIASQVKLWPDKIIGSGSSINISVIWGENWPGALFSALGVRGLANRQITPEFAARLGSAYGACLPEGSTVIASRSPHKISRVIKRALLGGLLSVGVNAQDARILPLPASRRSVKATGASGGFHIRLSPYNPEMALIEFFDKNGINIDTNQERKIENVFFRQDFRRVDVARVGALQTETALMDRYLEDVAASVDMGLIRGQRLRIVVDYSNGSLSVLLPRILGRLKCDVVSLNAHVDPEISPRPSTLEQKGLADLAHTVKSLKADFGILVDGESEKIALSDGAGKIISGDRLLALVLKLACMELSRPTVALQMRSPWIADEIVRKAKGHSVFVKSNSRSLMQEALANPDIRFAGDTKGGFIFPDFQPAFDGMETILKLMETLAKHKITLDELNARTPEIFIAEMSLPCSWEQKGGLMRGLVDRFEKKKPELIDGIKVKEGPGRWALVRPHPSDPSVSVVAEGRDRKEARQLARKYADAVKEIIRA